jgi:hypothetical protein
VIYVGLSLVAVALFGLWIYEPRPEGPGLSRAEIADIKRGNWRDALEPLETLPTNAEASAAEVAKRLSLRYCEDESTNMTEQHTTDHDYVMYVPGCLDIAEPADRLESASAELMVLVGEPPTLEFGGRLALRPCLVNVGAQYEEHGTCIKDLLKGALDEI